MTTPTLIPLPEAIDPREAPCVSSPTGKHDYRGDGSTWDSDSYRCSHCGDRYTTYDSEMQ